MQVAKLNELVKGFTATTSKTDLHLQTPERPKSAVNGTFELKKNALP